MDNYHSLIYKRLIDIADIQRTQKDMIYPAKTIYVQVSACKRGGEDSWMITKDAGILESKFAVAIPKIEIYPEYFLICLNAYTPEWFAKYVGTNINIAMDDFKYFEIGYTNNIEIQKHYAEMIETADRQITLENEITDRCRTVKKWYLEKMFLGQED